MQMFDQEIAPAFAFTKKFTHLSERAGIDLTAFRRPGRAAPASLSAIVGRRCRRWLD
jgi:hypothetical protein